MLVVTGLLSWQLSNLPFLQHSSQTQRINAEIRVAIKQSQGIQLIESAARFPNTETSSQPPLLITAVLQG